MCNQPYSQLVAGEFVTLRSVSVSWPRKGWLGSLLGWLWCRKALIDLSVVRGLDLQLRIEASRPNAGSVWIPHRDIFADVCPPNRSKKQQILWGILRRELSKEIAMHKSLHESRLLAARQALMNELRTDVLTPLPPKEDMVVFPEVRVIPVPSPATPVRLRLVSDDRLSEPAMKVEEKAAKPAPNLDGYQRLMPCHLELKYYKDDFFGLETLHGWVVFYRYMALGRDSFQLRLEDVPVGHSLYGLFVQEQSEERKISVWIDRYGFMPSAADSTSTFLAEYLRHEAWQDERSCLVVSV